MTVWYFVVMIQRPERSEYSDYHVDYIGRVPEGDVIGFLSTQLDAYLHTLARIAEDRAGKAWKEGKWTLKQEVGHLIDSERIMSYRALCIARGEIQPLPSWDQDNYTAQGGADKRTLQDLTRELELLRRANLMQFAGMSPETAARMGTSSGNPISVRALLYILAGHAQRHLDLIREHYLN